MRALSRIPSRARRWFTLGSVALTIFTWLWVPVAFTAREDAWWNNIYLLVGCYAMSTFLALVGSRSVLGHLPLVAAVASLGLTCVFVV